ncbi:MAG: site-specific integrase [Prevotella sp.]|nr:site-specific integrase [Prevotella sp.]
MIKTAVIFDRKKQAERDKDGALEIRVTYNRKSYYIYTGMRVRAKHWAGAVVNRPDADALNNRLRIVVARVNEKVNDFIEHRRPIDMAAIKEYIYDGTKVAGKEDRMMAWMEDQVGQLNVCGGTRKHYELLIVRLKEFGKLRAWSDLTVENIYLWDDWLHKMENVNARKPIQERLGAVATVSDGTIHNYHKHLKALLNRAVEFGMIEASPYARLRGKFKTGDNESVEYLTEDQMKLILNTRPVPGTQMETVRDLFVFQMYTGMSYSDMQAFDIKQYKEEVVRDKISGKKTKRFVYRGERVKTGVPYVAVLLPPVVDVLERHGWQVPQMPNQKYNCLLKTFGAVIGVEGMHSHLARHTFATYMLSKDVKVQNVMRMLGHRKIEQTMRYAKVLAKDVYDDFEKIAEKF